jgi:two-component system response regulator QseB
MIDARPRLLYVEDDADIAEMTLEVLGETYAVDHVSDGDVALRRALDERYDVMLVDRRLPGMDGARLVEAVRTARITTPVLMLTALGAVPDRVEGLDAGANDYLTKPFDFDELLARPRAAPRLPGGGPSSGHRRVDVHPRLLGAAFAHRRSGVADGHGGRLPGVPVREPRARVQPRGDPAGVFSSADGVGTVDTYVHYIRRKTTPEMIDTVRGRGYRAGIRDDPRTRRRGTAS